MLKIRREQIEVFEQAAIRNFEDRMVNHLREFTPRHFRILQEEDIRRVIRFGMERAQNHDLTSERSVRLYVEMMFMLGSHFDTDPQVPWAAEILNDKSIPDEVTRVDRLNDRAWDYVDHILLDYRRVEGTTADHTRLIKELRKLRQGRDEILSPAGISEFYRDVLARLRQIFPNKYEYVGELSLRRLIQRGITSARNHRITAERGVTMIIAMMFVLGAGFDSDPLAPWASVVLRDPNIADESERANRLYAEAISTLRQWWGTEITENES